MNLAAYPQPKQNKEKESTLPAEIIQGFRGQESEPTDNTRLLIHPSMYPGMEIST